MFHIFSVTYFEFYNYLPFKFSMLLHLAVTVWRYGNCGTKLLLNCLPAQMYIKISNVSTNTQLSEALPAASRGLLSAAQNLAKRSHERSE